MYSVACNARVCDRVEITLLDVIDLQYLLSKSRPTSRVLLFQYTRHTIYKSVSFSLLTIIKLMKAQNEDDTVAEYRAFGEHHQFIDESVIGVFFYLFKTKELHSLYVQETTELGIEKCINKIWLKQNILDLFTITHSQNAGNGAMDASNEVMQSMLEML